MGLERKDDFMGKWSKRFISVMAIILAITVIVSVVFMHNINILSTETAKIIRIILVLICLLVAVATIVYLVIYVFL